MRANHTAESENTLEDEFGGTDLDSYVRANTDRV
jgi:hypothetical protein